LGKISGIEVVEKGGLRQRGHLRTSTTHIGGTGEQRKLDHFDHLRSYLTGMGTRRHLGHLDIHLDFICKSARNLRYLFLEKQNSSSHLLHGGQPMLTIRSEQLRAFQQQAEKTFATSVVSQLRTRHAEAIKDVPEDSLPRLVEHGIRRAREYGLTWQNNLSSFVTLMFEVSPEFDKCPAFRRYLTDENIPPDDRMGLVLRETTSDDWQAAQEDSTLSGWPEDLLRGIQT